MRAAVYELIRCSVIPVAAMAVRGWRLNSSCVRARSPAQRLRPSRADRCCRSSSIERTRAAALPHPKDFTTTSARRARHRRDSSARSRAAGARAGDGLRVLVAPGLRAGLVQDAHVWRRSRGGRAERVRHRGGQAPPAAAARRGTARRRPRMAAADRPRAGARVPDRAGPGRRAAPSSGSPRAWRSGWPSRCWSGSDSTRWPSAARSPHGRVRTTRRCSRRRLDLDTLGTPRGFTVRHLRDGSLPTYQLAFLMADYLSRRDGFDRAGGVLPRLRQGGAQPREVPRSSGSRCRISRRR